MTQPSKPLDDPILDILIDDIIALGTDHPNGAFPDGKREDESHAPQNHQEAKQALLKWRSDYVMGIIGEDEGEPKSLQGTGHVPRSIIRNDLRAEQRRKLKGKGE